MYIAAGEPTRMMAATKCIKPLASAFYVKLQSELAIILSVFNDQRYCHLSTSLHRSTRQQNGFEFYGQCNNPVYRSQTNIKKGDACPAFGHVRE
jgi:hypothetical protein